MNSFKSADPKYFIIERQLSKINVTSTIYTVARIMGVAKILHENARI